MSDDFFARMDELERAVGHGDLEIEVNVDQVYAHYIHEGVSRSGRPLVYHQGGKDHFLHDAVINDASGHMQKLADRAITENGSDLTGAAIDLGIHIKDQASEDTPREFVNLARSGAVTVTDDGSEVYHRPADVHRLSDAELRAQRDHGNDLDYGRHSNPRL